MGLKDTVKLMESGDYKERFKAEYYQLKIRLNGLSEMLKKYKAGTLSFKPTCEYETLYKQYVHMADYKLDLEFRAELEGIEL